MITFKREDGQTVHICELAGELPELTGAKELFADVETNGLFPHSAVHKHRACGWAVTVDDHSEAWYAPFRHNTRGNLPIDAVTRWMQTWPKEADWVNHNVKFDAHFASVDGYEHLGAMVDTVVAAKLHNSDELDFGLKTLGEKWLEIPPAERDEVDDYIRNLKAAARKGPRGKPKREVTFADVPVDILGRYACNDVLLNRKLYRWLNENRPSTTEELWRTEKLLTPVLYDMEQEGFRVSLNRIRAEQYRCLAFLINSCQAIEELAGIEYTDSAKCNFDLFVNILGLPILAHNDEGNPSFDKHALARYAVHPQVLADDRTKRIVDLVHRHRQEQHFSSMFLNVFLEQADANGVLRPSYNQVVRTGRMSCRKPNAQQMSPRAKKLIVPPEGMSIISADASQVEFRLIVHFICDLEAIEAYKTNPRTDFHQWVADQLGIRRKPAKNINFATAYGAGKRKVTSMLATNPDVMEEVGERINVMVENGTVSEDNRDASYRQFCAQLANSIYTNYHDRFPVFA